MIPSKRRVKEGDHGNCQQGLDHYTIGHSVHELPHESTQFFKGKSLKMCEGKIYLFIYDITQITANIQNLDQGKTRRWREGSV